ncbi:cellulase family glycosylhydrolase [Conexibacter sp. CPCC 206217]|uniref:cellulase family glycosylhydrolase n=1 Tax=Conexibacter sp. CPCC 206217 TaxID=3064574 RepID=UPI00271810E6|nr:cellulase family glycosylhydrolase [Conexibacter sp. CPCC 206217]MDO8210513.1 cellulase family glycosylhydrolase [Conexibacter sp. CPCC 206217]
MTGLALLVPAVTASANSKQFTTVEAPGELLDGSPGQALDEIDDLGADAIRIQLSWAGLAPNSSATRAPSFNATDPNAYSGWERYDAAVDGARERGLKVQITIGGAAPRWATPKHDGLTRPDPTAFGKFATAVGRHFGSKVSWWSIWNEPNLGKFLKPIASNQSATVYRNLYLKAYSGLRSAGVRAPILVGELAPIGNSIRDVGTIRPLQFLRSMLCLDKNYRRAKGTRCAKLPTQGLAIHPYSTKAGPFLTPPVDNLTIGVLPRATEALDKAARAGAIAARTPLYVTEFGVQSYPDKRTGVPLDVQSDYRSIAEYIAYSNSRVKSFSQYLLRDDDDDTGGNRYGAFESGLFLFKGRKPKPSLYSFRLPLVVIANRGSTTRATLWGLVRPGKQARRGGSVTLEYADGSGAWKRIGSQRYSSSGYFKRAVATKKGRKFRVLWTAPDGTKYTGPRTVARAAAPTA